jgi:hypothetical protein
LLRLPRRQSISVKLPALISALLVLAFAVFSLVAYRSLKRVLLSTASSRVTSATHVLVGLTEDSERRLRAESEKIAADSSVGRFASYPTPANRAAAQKALAKVATSAPQTIGIELRDHQLHRTLWVDGRSPDSARFIRDGLQGHFRLGKDPVGKIQSENAAEKNNLFYSVTSPVISPKGDTAGFVLVYKRISSATAAQTIGRLIGSEASMFMGNTDGSVWTDLSKVVRGPTPYKADRNLLIYTGPDGSKRIGYAARVARTPWVVWAGVPFDVAMAPADRFLRDTIIAALILALVGGLMALLISRQITQRLREMTLAAQHTREDLEARVTLSPSYQRSRRA